MGKEGNYKNSIVLVANYICVGDRILWIRRGIEPDRGKWALPGGFMETGETPEQAACRELAEETGIIANPDALTLVSVMTILHMTQTHLVFRCHFGDMPQTRPSEEATHFGWFKEDEVPWEEIAFPTVEPQIRQMYEWLRDGRYGIRVGVADENGSHFKYYKLAEPGEDD